MKRLALSFRRVRVTSEPVHAESRADAFTGVRRFGGADGFVLTIHESVIERATAFGKLATPNEMYAILVGRLCRDAEGDHVVVLGVVPDEDAHTGPGHVRTTIGSETTTRELARRLFPDLVCVGWFHTHPGIRAIYSHTDMGNQRSWSKPHHIGVVLDPESGELNVYRGPNAELLVEEEAEPRRAAGAKIGAKSAPVAVDRESAADAGEQSAGDECRMALAVAATILALTLIAMPGVLALRASISLAAEVATLRSRVAQMSPSPDTSPAPTPVSQVAAEPRRIEPVATWAHPATEELACRESPLVSLDP